MAKRSRTGRVRVGVSQAGAPRERAGRGALAGFAGQVTSQFTGHFAGQISGLTGLVGLSGLMVALPPEQALADPRGGVVTQGAATISRQGASTVITQSTGRAALSWESFDIDAGESVRFRQPSTSSVALNTVTNRRPTEIQGQLTANGQVWIQNPEGVVFGRGAQVEVGGLLATTAELPDDAFAAGEGRFAPAGGAGSVVNEGQILAGDGGVVFVAPVVENHGEIVARGGTVDLAAADGFTVDFEGDGLLQVELDPEEARALEIVQDGTIRAEGGAVRLTAAQAEAVRDSLVSVGGIVEATGIAEIDGEIVITGGDVGGVASLTGEVSAPGGTVSVNAEEIRVATTARVSASAPAGGGRVEIGVRPSDPAPVVRLATAPDAAPELAPVPPKRIGVARGAVLAADATVSGDAGRVDFWSTDATIVSGRVTAISEAGGDGGRVDISSAGTIGFDGEVDLAAFEGVAGTLLFDPVTIVVQNPPPQQDDPNVADNGRIEATDPPLLGEMAAFVSPFAIENAAFSEIFLGATSSITFNDAVNLDNRSLTAQAPTVNFNSLITLTESASLTANAATVNVGATGGFFFTRTTFGNGVTLNASGSVNVPASATATFVGTASTSGGFFTVTGGPNTVNINRNIALTQTSVSIAGDNFANVTTGAISNSNSTIAVSTGISGTVTIGGAVTGVGVGSSIDITGGSNSEVQIDAPVTLGGTLGGITISGGPVDINANIAATGNATIDIDGNEHDGFVAAIDLNDSSTISSQLGTIDLDGTLAAGNGINLNGAVSSTAGEITITANDGDLRAASVSSTSGNITVETLGEFEDMEIRGISTTDGDVVLSAGDDLEIFDGTFSSSGSVGSVNGSVTLAAGTTTVLGFIDVFEPVTAGNGITATGDAVNIGAHENDNATDIIIGRFPGSFTANGGDIDINGGTVEIVGDVNAVAGNVDIDAQSVFIESIAIVEGNDVDITATGGGVRQVTAIGGNLDDSGETIIADGAEVTDGITIEAPEIALAGSLQSSGFITLTAQDAEGNAGPIEIAEFDGDLPFTVVITDFGEGSSLDNAGLTNGAVGPGTVQATGAFTASGSTVTIEPAGFSAASASITATGDVRVEAPAGGAFTVPATLEIRQAGGANALVSVVGPTFDIDGLDIDAVGTGSGVGLGLGLDVDGPIGVDASGDITIGAVPSAGAVRLSGANVSLQRATGSFASLDVMATLSANLGADSLDVAGNVTVAAQDDIDIISDESDPVDLDIDGTLDLTLSGNSGTVTFGEFDGDDDTLVDVAGDVTVNVGSAYDVEFNGPGAYTFQSDLTINLGGGGFNYTNTPTVTVGDDLLITSTAITFFGNIGTSDTEILDTPANSATVRTTTGDISIFDTVTVTDNDLIFDSAKSFVSERSITVTNGSLEIDAVENADLFSTSGEGFSLSTYTAAGIDVTANDINVQGDISSGGPLTLDGTSAVSIFPNAFEGDNFDIRTTAAGDVTIDADTVVLEADVTVFDGTLDVDGGDVIFGTPVFGVGGAVKGFVGSLTVTTGSVDVDGASAQIFGDMVASAGTIDIEVTGDIFAESTATIQANSVDMTAAGSLFQASVDAAELIGGGGPPTTIIAEEGDITLTGVDVEVYGTLDAQAGSISVTATGPAGGGNDGVAFFGPQSAGAVPGQPAFDRSGAGTAGTITAQGPAAGAANGTFDVDAGTITVDVTSLTAGAVDLDATDSASVTAAAGTVSNTLAITTLNTAALTLSGVGIGSLDIDSTGGMADVDLGGLGVGGGLDIQGQTGARLDNTGAGALTVGAGFTIGSAAGPVTVDTGTGAGIQATGAVDLDAGGAILVSGTAPLSSEAGVTADLAGAGTAFSNTAPISAGLGIVVNGDGVPAGATAEIGAALTAGTAPAQTGPIAVSGSTVTVSAGASTADGPVSLIGPDGVSIQAGASIESTGGAVLLQADAGPVTVDGTATAATDATVITGQDLDIQSGGDLTAPNGTLSLQTSGNATLGAMASLDAQAIEIRADGTITVQGGAFLSASGFGTDLVPNDFSILLAGSDFNLQGGSYSGQIVTAVIEGGGSLGGTTGTISAAEFQTLDAPEVRIVATGPLEVQDLSPAGEFVLEELTLASSGPMTIPGEVAGGDAGLGASFALNLGDPRGAVVTPSLAISGRVGVITGQNGLVGVAPSSLLFTVGGDVTVNSGLSDSSTVLNAGAATIDVTGNFLQANTGTAPSPLTRGEGGFGVFFGSLTILDVQQLSIFGVINGQGGADAAQQVAAGGGFTLSDLQTVNDCPVTSATCSAAPVLIDGMLDTDEDMATDPLDISDLAEDADGDAVMITSIDGQEIEIGGSVPGPEGGQFTLLEDGTLIFEPLEDFQGLMMDVPQVFTVELGVTDAGGESATSTLTVTVLGVNDLPVAMDGALATDEDMASDTLAPDAIATDVDMDALAFATIDGQAVTAGEAQVIELSGGQGQILVAADGSLSFDPAGGFETLTTGEAQEVAVPVTLVDAFGGTAEATVTVTVAGVNDLPTGMGGSLETTEDMTSDPLAALALFMDAEMEALSIVAVGTTAVDGPAVIDLPGGGQLIVAANGTVTFDPAGEFDGLVEGAVQVQTVDLTVADASGGTATVPLSIAVTGLFDGLVLVPGEIATDEDMASAPLAPDALGGAGAEGLTITAIDGAAPGPEGVPGPDGGTLFLDASGNLVFDPGADFQGLMQDAVEAGTVTVTLEDAGGITSTTEVTITVGGLNDAPDTPMGLIETTEDMASAGLGADALGMDPDMDALRITEIEGQAAEDGVAIPVAGGGFLRVEEGGTVLVFEPGDGFQGLMEGESVPLSASVTVADPFAGQATGTVDIVVGGLNDAPQGMDAAITTAEDMLSAGLGVEAVASDIDMDALAFTEIAGQPATGVVVLPGEGQVFIGAGGALFFDPGQDFTDLGLGETRQVQIPVTVADDAGGTAMATVTVTVTGVAGDTGTEPSALPGAIATTEDMASDGLLPGLLLINAEGDMPAFTAINGQPVTGPIAVEGGTLFVDPETGALFFDPGEGFQGLTSGGESQFTVTATLTDGTELSLDTPVTVTVTGLNDGPVGMPGMIATDEDMASAGLPVSALATDPEMQAVVITAVNGEPLDAPVSVEGGQFFLDAEGRLVFDPGDAFQSLGAGATESFTVSVTVADPDQANATVSVTVDVLGLNDAPTPIPTDPDDPTGGITISTPEDDPTDAIVPGTIVIDPENDEVVLVAVDGTPVMAGDTVALEGGGRLVIDEAGNLVFDPGTDFDFLGTDDIREIPVTLTLSDGSGATTMTDVLITVIGVNDGPSLAPATIDTDEDTAAPGIGAADFGTDPEMDPLSIITVEGQPLSVGETIALEGGGTLTLGEDGALIFDPGPDFQDLGVGETRQRVVSVEVSDPENAAASGDLVFVVLGANDAPVGGAGAIGTTEDMVSAALDAAGIARDPDASDMLNVVSIDGQPVAPGQSVAVAGGGTLMLAIDGTLVFDPGQEFQSLGAVEGERLMVVLGVADGSGELAEVTLDIDIAGANDAPVAIDDPAATTPADTPVVLNLLINDSDIDGDVLAISAVNGLEIAPGGTVAGAAGGQFNLSADGTFLTFDPGSDFEMLAINATEVFDVTYSISDGFGGIASASTSLQLTGVVPPIVNDPVAESIPNLVVTPDVIDDAVLTPDPEIEFGFFSDLGFVQPELVDLEPVTNRANDEDWERE